MVYAKSFLVGRSIETIGMAENSKLHILNTNAIFRPSWGAEVSAIVAYLDSHCFFSKPVSQINFSYIHILSGRSKN
jgi:hypothetical protein